MGIDGSMDGMDDASLLGGFWEYESVMGMGRSGIGVRSISNLIS